MSDVNQGTTDVAAPLSGHPGRGMARSFLIFAVVFGLLFPLMGGDPKTIDALSAVAAMWISIVVSALFVSAIEWALGKLPAHG